jgi:hypothetical protein
MNNVKNDFRDWRDCFRLIQVLLRDDAKDHGGSWWSRRRPSRTLFFPALAAEIDQLIRGAIAGTLKRREQ